MCLNVSMAMLLSAGGTHYWEIESSESGAKGIQICCHMRVRTMSHNFGPGINTTNREYIKDDRLTLTSRLFLG